MRLVTGLVKDRLLGCMGQAGFTAGSLAGKGARGGTRETENKVSSKKELMEIGRVAESDRGRAGKKVASGGIRYEDVVTFFEDRW